MLRRLLTFAPPVALVLVGVLLLEPPHLTPADRIPTLRLLTEEGQRQARQDGQLRATLARLLGPSPDGGERVRVLEFGSDVVVVEWWLNEPGQPSQRRISAEDEAYALLRWARLVSTAPQGLVPNRFTFVGRQHSGAGAGTGSQRPMIELTYSAEQVADIDWDTFRPADVYAVAETAVVDPTLLGGTPVR